MSAHIGFRGKLSDTCHCSQCCTIRASRREHTPDESHSPAINTNEMAYAWALERHLGSHGIPYHPGDFALHRANHEAIAADRLITESLPVPC